jgi:PAS domain S-box-containing protein
MSVSITLHDISALTQAERALQDMNAKLEIRVSERTQELSKAHRDSKAIFETINAQFLYSEADLQSNIIYVNDNLCTATGFNREELIGQNHNILNSGIHPKEFWSEMWEQLSHGKSWRAEICNRSRNGKSHWYDSVMAPVMNEEGQIERIVSLRSDITERVQIGRQLKIIGDQLSVAINVAKLGVWTWDLSTDRLKWNDRMYEIYDQPKELGAAGLKYHHWRDRVHSEDVEATEASLIGAVEGREEFTPTFRIYSPSRGLRYVLAGAQVVRDSQGKALKVTGINFDVTDQVMLEFELRGAKKEADVASELKSQFLANMSHEIRTPMNGVIGMTDLLLGTELNEIQHNYAKTVKSSADSLLAIINDILDFSKVEKGMLDLNAVEFDLGEMLHEIGRNMSFRAYDKGLELICPANYMPQQWVNADLGRIRQILNNLLGNALKFTKQGEVALYCTVQEQTTLHTKILIEVTDTGIGLSEEQQSKLFQRFSQADGSTTRKFGGTGLGLSISKQLVELMGGEIGVKSTEGKGSTFWFTLDLANAKALAPLPSMDDLTGQKVLVVDDNLTSRTLLLQLLTNWQMEHALVDSGEAALVRLTAAAAEGKPFSIAIVDMQMPEMDGAQLGAVIKNDSALADTHLVMLISQEASGDAKKLKEAGFDGYLNKPVVETVLYNALRQVAVITANEQPLITVYTSSELPKFNARVLVVVEDNITNQIVAQCMLEEFGIQVDLAANGEEALTALETLPYDIVFMDCQMPVMDGYEATRSIREPTFNFHASREHDRAIPIIAVTANTMQGDREKCFAAGMDDFIAKPVELEKLQQALQRWLPEPEAEKAPQIVDTNFNKASN